MLVSGGWQRYLMGGCAGRVDGCVGDLRAAATALRADWQEPAPAVGVLRATQRQLENRLTAYGAYRDGLQIWAALGVTNPESVPLLDRDSLVALKEGLPT